MARSARRAYTINRLDESVEGKRIKVTRVMVGEAERMGFVKDTERLLGQEGVALCLRPAKYGIDAQLEVRWDTKFPGSLMVVGLDEVEVLEEL